MRMLPYLLLLAALIAGLVWASQRVGDRRRSALGGVDVGAPAVLAWGPDSGPGHLRLGPTQLVFTAESGRVLVVERLDIVGATVTHELPGRTSASALMAIAAQDEVHYFLLDQPEAWVRRITGSPDA